MSDHAPWCPRNGGMQCTCGPDGGECLVHYDEGEHPSAIALLRARAEQAERDFAEQAERDFAEARDLIAEAQARQEQAEREVDLLRTERDIAISTVATRERQRDGWEADAKIYAQNAGFHEAKYDALRARVLALAEEWATYKGNFHPENVAYQQGRHDCAIALREAVEGDK